MKTSEPQQYALQDLKAHIDMGNVGELMLLQPLVIDENEYAAGVAVRVFRTTPGYAWVLDKVTTRQDVTPYVACQCESWDTLLGYIEGVQTESRNWTIIKPPNTTQSNNI
ncbi:MAG TPA: hypothetical protein VFB12_17310 [Ktedonobacteraceae bacterium]|nr:hypothetical protein [Ktedonobacteraceae bacterium]